MIAMTTADYRTLARDSRLSYARPAVWRMDAPKALLMGRMQTWAERLNRMIFASRSWEGLETIERRFYRLLNDRRVRCEVYEANNH